MARDTLWWLLGAACVMIAVPWLCSVFVPADASLPLTLLLLYAVEPLYTLFVGGHAGKNVRHLFWLPIANALFSLLGVWLAFDFGNVDFIWYALVLLVLGIVAMSGVAMYHRRQKRRVPSPSDLRNGQRR